MAKDPVCGMEVHDTDKAATAEYNGKQYYFCSEMCKNKFTEESEKYVEKNDDDEHEHHHHSH